MDIVIAPQGSLLIPSYRVKAVKRDFAIEMANFMEIADGIGLAAPQVGYNVRLIAIHASQAKFGLSKSAVFHEGKNVGLVLANPEILATTFVQGDLVKGEACLSLPKAPTARVQRFAEIKLKYNTIEGDEVTEWIRGILATIVQHEIDHLDGILYPARSKSYNAVYDTYSKLHQIDRQKMDRFHEVMIRNIKQPGLGVEYSREDFHKFCKDLDIMQAEIDLLWQRIQDFQ